MTGRACGADDACGYEAVVCAEAAAAASERALHNMMYIGNVIVVFGNRGDNAARVPCVGETIRMLREIVEDRTGRRGGSVGDSGGGSGSGSV